MTFDIEFKFKESGVTISDTIELSSITSESADKKITLTAVDHYDHCEMLYYIAKPDVRFADKDNKLYIQANLTSKSDTDSGRNGSGYVETKM